MGLLETLECGRIGLDGVDWENIKIESSFDESNLKGRIAQILVGEWLSGCDYISMDEKFPRLAGRYSLKKNDMGVTVYNSKHNSIHEFDFMFYYDRNPCVAEVKSYKLHGFSKHIDESIGLAEEIYSTRNISMLLIFPICKEKREFACELHEKHPNLHCIDIGYAMDDLDALMGRFVKTREGYRYDAGKIKQKVN